MEEAVKSIENLTEQILPKQPYYLSLSPTRKYKIPSDEKRLDEQEQKPLQYITLVGGEADRGVLITRAYFTVREEPNSSSNAPTPTTLKVDPNKPRKKVSLKDYKNKKVEGDSPPKSEEKANGLPTLKEKEEIKISADTATKEMDNHRDGKKPIANPKMEVARRRSPSPERRKRVAEVDEGPKIIKRMKVGDATPNGAAPRPSKEAKEMTPQKLARSSLPGKNETKDSKSLPATNGRPASSSSALRVVSPKPTVQVNGRPRPTSNGQAMHKRAVSNSGPVSQSVPRLLSPLNIAELSVDKSSDTPTRPSPKKKPAETTSLKPQPKKLQDSRDPSPNPKKRKIVPPLLSPTLPPVVMDELARFEKKTGTPSKEVSQKSSQASDSSVRVKNPSKSSRREETIHVDNKKEEPTQYLVTMKYKKRHAKTIERLLNLPPSGGKKKIEALKKDDRAPRESSTSVEPGTARKRPRAATDTSEASKRPKTSDSLRPSTPPKQSTAMSRIASNSSQAGTPGAANSSTPSVQLPTDKQRPPIPPERLQKAQRFHSGHKFFMELGTKLKHERDAIMKSKVAVKEREHQTAVAAGIQSLLLYMHAVKLQSDALDLERQPRRLQSWREVLPLFRVVRSDCNRNAQLLALLFRMQGICMNYMGRSLWFLPNEPDAAEKAIASSREESEIWRQAENERRRLGIFDGNSDTSDGGAVGKLIDRLGPWTSPEEAIPITLEVLRKVIRIDGPWKPVEELAKIGRSVTNGMSA
ncbi:hypothetical protein F5Y19DRAFT_198943 [Xylariaceae sp. FL1651]|nr:hypothetical protein F5Y19DRAFT_198943 [Xylariaceae sp. FL1651]